MPDPTPLTDSTTTSVPGHVADHEALLASLPLEDKVRLCAGADVWHTVALPDHGVPALKLSDGPTGVRGATFTSARSTSYPCGTAVGATFSPELAARLGRALATEARAKGVSVMLGPTVNLHRTPLAGRNFECYGEDPHLTAAMAVAYIRAMQEEGVGACIKHLVCNDAEHERTRMSSDVDPRPLRELYLHPFEQAVQAGVWAVMTSYNRVNSTHADAHADIVGRILKEEWGFDGLVMSDWLGTTSTAPSALAGLDLEMPGPPRRFGRHLLEAVRGGGVPEEVVDDKVRRLLRLADRTGGLDRPASGPEPSTGSPEHRALARELATESFVLLRNTSPGGDDRPLLPLTAGDLGTVAVLGPNAVDPAAMGGGSSAVRTYGLASPAEALAGALDGRAEVVAEAGADNGRAAVPLGDRFLDGPVTLSYHPLDQPDAPALAIEETDALALLWFGDTPAGVPDAFTVVARARLGSGVAAGTTVALASGGSATLSFDGAPVTATGEAAGSVSADQVLRSEPVPVPSPADGGPGPEIVVRYDHAGTELMGGVTVTARPPDDPGRFDRAVAAADRADTAVVVVGSHDRWETEGRDRTTLALPGDQDDLVRAVAAVNPRTVVVVNAGAPVTMPWADEVAAILVTWFPGLEGGPALADVLLGGREPGGRLPVTFPRRVEDTPSFTSDPGEAGHLRYGEGLFIGHRWYEARGVVPAFPFGAGQGYTTFRYEAATTTAPAGGGGLPPVVEVTLTNTGTRPGREVVQLYAARPPGELRQPSRVLAGFAKVTLEPGETRTVSVPVAVEAVRSWHPDRGWVLPDGRYELHVGPSSAELPLAAAVTVPPAGDGNR